VIYVFTAAVLQQRAKHNQQNRQQTNIQQENRKSQQIFVACTESVEFSKQTISSKRSYVTYIKKPNRLEGLKNTKMPVDQ
jgi:hypothetical protein